MAHVAHHRFWRWRATAAALLLLGGCVVHEIATRTLRVEHVAVPAAQATVTTAAPIKTSAAQNRLDTRGSQDPQHIPDALPPYAADHLDAHFIDFSHPEPLSPESIRAMALAQFLDLSATEHQLHAGR